MNSLAGGLGKGLGDAMGGGGPFMGGDAQSAAYGTGLNGSGWIVNMGGTQVASSSPTQSSGDALPKLAQAGLSLPILAVVGAGGFLLWRMRKGRK